MAGPGIVVIAGTITAYLAVVSNDGLVVDDYYKQGLAVNQVMERNQRAEQIGLQAELLRSDDGSQLRVFAGQGSGCFSASASFACYASDAQRG